MFRSRNNIIKGKVLCVTELDSCIYIEPQRDGQKHAWLQHWHLICNTHAFHQLDPRTKFLKEKADLFLLQFIALYT
jgi:hypothetical protein